MVNCLLMVNTMSTNLKVYQCNVIPELPSYRMCKHFYWDEFEDDLLAFSVDYNCFLPELYEQHKFASIMGSNTSWRFGCT